MKIYLFRILNDWLLELMYNIWVVFEEMIEYEYKIWILLIDINMNWRNEYIEVIFLEIMIELNKYENLWVRLNEDRFCCEDFCIHFLYFFIRYFDDWNIKWWWIYRKNDLIEFFVYNDFINLQDISFDQEINNNLFNDLKFDWEI